MVTPYYSINIELLLYELCKPIVMKILEYWRDKKQSYNSFENIVVENFVYLLVNSVDKESFLRSIDEFIINQCDAIV